VGVVVGTALSLVPSIAEAGTSPPGLLAHEDGNHTTDELLAEVGRQVPTFGGMYVDGGQLVILLTDDGESLAAAADALRAIETLDVAGMTPVFARADYSWVQLMDWFGRLGDIAGMNGVVWSDIDDRANRLGIPRPAVVIEEAESVVIPALEHPTQSVGSQRSPGAVILLLVAALIVLVTSSTVVWSVRRSR
jgi:hypothetical protein